MDKKKENNDKRKIPTCFLSLCTILNVKEFKVSVEQGRVVTTLNIIKD